jgi:hypothetical protein
MPDGVRYLNPSMSHLPTLREIRGRCYGKFAPASTLVEVGHSQIQT